MYTYLDCEYSENIYPTIFPLYGVCTQGFIQNFSVGVEKNMCIEPRPLGGCGVMLPQKILVL